MYIYMSVCLCITAGDHGLAALFGWVFHNVTSCVAEATARLNSPRSHQHSRLLPNSRRRRLPRVRMSLSPSSSRSNSSNCNSSCNSCSNCNNCSSSICNSICNNRWGQRRKVAAAKVAKAAKRPRHKQSRSQRLNQCLRVNPRRRRSLSQKPKRMVKNQKEQSVQSTPSAKAAASAGHAAAKSPPPASSQTVVERRPSQSLKEDAKTKKKEKDVAKDAAKETEHSPQAKAPALKRQEEEEERKREERREREEDRRREEEAKKEKKERLSAEETGKKKESKAKAAQPSAAPSVEKSAGFSQTAAHTSSCATPRHSQSSLKRSFRRNRNHQHHLCSHLPCHPHSHRCQRRHIQHIRQSLWIPCGQITNQVSTWTLLAPQVRQRCKRIQRRWHFHLRLQSHHHQHHAVTWQGWSQRPSALLQLLRWIQAWGTFSALLPESILACCWQDQLQVCPHNLCCHHPALPSPSPTTLQVSRQQKQQLFQLCKGWERTAFLVERLVWTLEDWMVWEPLASPWHFSETTSWTQVASASRLDSRYAREFDARGVLPADDARYFQSLGDVSRSATCEFLAILFAIWHVWPYWLAQSWPEIAKACPWPTETPTNRHSRLQSWVIEQDKSTLT